MGEFVKVANKKDIPVGEGRIYMAGKNTEIALFNVKGTFHAISNNCPHRGGPMGEGALDGTVVTCPWHGWQFDVTTGALVMNPAEKVPCYKVKLKGDDVCVEI